MPAPGRPSRLELARLVSGDLSEAERETLQARVDRDPEAQRELADIRRNVEAFRPMADGHRARLLAVISRELPPPQEESWWRRSMLRYYIPALCTAVVAVVIVLALYSHVGVQPGNSPPLRPAGHAGEVAFKGGLALRVVARRGERQFMVRQGQRLRAGDDLRFVITTDGPGFLTVLSVDGRGAVSPFYPDRPPTEDPRPLRVGSAGRHLLEGSVILDDAPGPEHLVVVFSRRRFDRSAVHRRVGRALAGKGVGARVTAGSMGLPGRAEVHLISVEKAR